MMVIGRNSVADDFGENFRAARLRGIEIFQREKRRAFAENHSGALAIERPAFFRRRGLERIEADENQLGERVVAAGQNALVAAGADAFEGMPDRVRAGGAGVRDHLAGARDRTPPARRSPAFAAGNWRSKCGDRRCEVRPL